jgi:hypothetical protein
LLPGGSVAQPPSSNAAANAAATVDLSIRMEAVPRVESSDPSEVLFALDV